MTPINHNTLIVTADINQKEKLVYGSLNLFMPNRDKYNNDGKQSLPTVCTVVAVRDNEFIKEGDKLLLDHTSIANVGQRISLEDGVATLRIPVSHWILGKIEGEEITPLYGNVLAKRMYENPVSSIIITPDSYKKHYPTQGIVLKTPPEVKDLLPGTTIHYQKFADYEIFFNDEVGEQKSVIMVKNLDILGKEVA